MLSRFYCHFYDELPDRETSTPFHKFMKNVEFDFVIIMQKCAEEGNLTGEG